MRHACHEFFGIVHDRPKKAREGQFQVVVQIVLEVDRQVVLQRIDGVLRLVVRFDTLGSLQSNVVTRDSCLCWETVLFL